LGCARKYNSLIKMSLRAFSQDDIEVGMLLKDSEGWNQIPQDWQCLLNLEPQGCFAAELEGRCVATATAVNYEGRFGWVGMVLVDPKFRHQGIATQMIERTVDYLQTNGCQCQKLDATYAGARVYEKMGFTVEYEVQRWTVNLPAKVVEMDSAGLSLLTTDSLEVGTGIDRAAFGASRRELLHWYSSNEAPGFYLKHSQQLAGYALGRPGSGAWQMGPLVASDTAVAQNLMNAYLPGINSGPVIADVVADNKKAVSLLQGLGFEKRRVLCRMFRGENRWPGRPDQIFCLAGFEYG